MNGAVAIPAGMLTWSPALAPLGALALAALCALAAAGIYRRMRARMSRRKALLLMLPKLLLLALLILALAGPCWTRTERRSMESRVLALLDTSASMDVPDWDGLTRLARAQRWLGALRENLPAAVSLETIEFDTVLHGNRLSERPVSAEDIPGTDLGACLAALRERAELSTAAAVVLLTDGGDERVAPAILPDVPVHIVGFGSDPAGWNDVAVLDVFHPPSAEIGVDFEVAADLLSRTGGGERFAAGLQRVKVRLERLRDGQWEGVQVREADLTRHRARARFRLSSEDEGLQTFRVRLDNQPGELSHLNNVRPFDVDVRKRALHVLFFTREIGADLKMIRTELASDPGITFTALFRTIGERFTVQGERLPGSEDLGAGFPSDENLLALFDCIILGAFPAEDWHDAQVQALVRYVENGGAVVFLGGEQAFGRGGYALTPLAELVPWRLSPAEPEPARGDFPVAVPAASAGHPAVAGLSELLRGEESATVELLNLPGALKPGAATLLQAAFTDRSIPLAAEQSFGNGRVLAIASNTLWKWSRRSPMLREAFGLFWRQTVRYLGGFDEGGRLLAVKWNRPDFRPGESAEAEITVAGRHAASQLRFSASLTHDETTRRIPIEPLQGRREALSARLFFPERGAYRFALFAFEGERMLESYEKNFRVAPRLPEGARLETDEEFLRGLAERTSGLYVPESEVAAVARRIADASRVSTVAAQRSLVHGSPHFFLFALAVLTAEWILRRKMNLF